MFNLRLSFSPVNPLCAALVAATTLFAVDSHADDWPRFRGPDIDGISKETGWKSEGDPSIAWSAKVGLGHAGFVVSKGHAITTGHNGEADGTGTVFCFDAVSGDVNWKYEYAHPLDDNSYAGGTTCTPTIDGDVVYHVARRGQMTCLELATGAVKWQINLMTELEYDAPDWGFTGSPLVDGDRLILTAGDAGLALNKNDGSVIWKSKNGEAGYSSPYPISRAGRDLVILSNSKAYMCVDSATGEEMWRIKWLTRYGVNAAMPIVDGNHLFISTGYGKGGSLFRFADDAAETEPTQVWRSREFATQMNAGVLIDGYLYGIHGNERQDGSGLRCLHMENETEAWTETSIAHGAATVADGKIISISEQGELTIAPVSPEGYQPTLRKKILGAKCWTVPTLANGLLYCRNDTGEVAVVDLRK